MKGRAQLSPHGETVRAPTLSVPSTLRGRPTGTRIRKLGERTHGLSRSPFLCFRLCHGAEPTMMCVETLASSSG